MFWLLCFLRINTVEATYHIIDIFKVGPPCLLPLRISELINIENVFYLFSNFCIYRYRPNNTTHMSRRIRPLSHLLAFVFIPRYSLSVTHFRICEKPAKKETTKTELSLTFLECVRSSPLLFGRLFRLRASVTSRTESREKKVVLSNVRYRSNCC